MVQFIGRVWYVDNSGVTTVTVLVVVLQYRVELAGCVICERKREHINVKTYVTLHLQWSPSKYVLISQIRTLANVRDVPRSLIFVFTKANQLAGLYLDEVPPGWSKVLRPDAPSDGAREHVRTLSTSALASRIPSARPHSPPTFWNNASVFLQGVATYGESTYMNCFHSNCAQLLGTFWL